MRSGPLGSTGLTVSALGLGTVELGLPYGIGKTPPPDDAECVRLLHQARDGGVSYFDTAAAYGRSEELVGRAFPGSRDVVLATKVSLRDAAGAPLPAAGIPAAVAASLERSRRRLGVDTLDVVQIHSLDDGADLNDALLDVLSGHVEAGHVRFWGVSTYGPSAPRAVLRHRRRFDVLQVAYSILDRTLEDDVLPCCRDLDVGLVVRSVFLQGALSDRRRQLPERLRGLRQAADAVAGVAAGLGCSLPEVALRFALHESGAHVTLVGTAAGPELDANLQAAAAGPLPADAVTALRRIRVTDAELLNPGNWFPPDPAQPPAEEPHRSDSLPSSTA